MARKGIRLGRTQREILDLLGGGGQYSTSSLARLLDGESSSNRVRHSLARLKAAGLVVGTGEGHAHRWGISGQGMNVVAELAP